jgi:hypothetical protein
MTLNGRYDAGTSKHRNPFSSAIFVVQCNSLKKNLVKKISHLRRQDKKVPEFSHFVKIALLRNFPLKK